jgi:hypothetical protein
MFRTDNQVALNDALSQLYADHEPAFAAGYATQLAVDMLSLLPKRKQKEFINIVEKFNGQQLVGVKNILTGKEVMIRREDRGGPCDPSMERYHSM